MAATCWMKGSANCCLDNGECLGAPVRQRSTVAGPKIAAVERREARVPVQRHAGAFVRCPVVTSATPALRSLMQMREEVKAQAPRLPMKGPMNHACLLP